MVMPPTQIRRKLLHPDNEVVGASEDAAGNACAAAGDLAAAAQHCSAALRAVEGAYGAAGTATAHQQLKLAALQRQCRDAGEDVLLQHAALSTLTLYHGREAAQRCCARAGVL